MINIVQFQEYIEYKLVAFSEESEELVVDTFPFPSCCICKVKRKHDFKYKFPRWLQANQRRPIGPVWADWLALRSRYLKRPSWKFKIFSSSGSMHL